MLGKRKSDIAHITLLCIVLDILFTLHWYNLYGERIELNPIGNFMLNHPWMLPIKVTVSFFVLKYLDWNSKNELYNLCRWTLCIAYVTLTIYHIILFIVAR